MKLKRLRFFAQLLTVAVIYFAAARLGLSLASVHTSVSPVWPPTGIAMAAVLLLGYRAWPGILLGAFLANSLTPVPLATALGIAAGNTMEALSAGYLLRRLDFHNALDRARDVFNFVLAALLCTMISATIGNISLGLGHAARWEQFGSLWLTWWLGDTVGGLVIAPLLLTWGTKSRQWLPAKRYLEATLTLLLLSLSALATFGKPSPLSIQYYPLARLIVPFFLWAAFRLGQRGITLATVLLSVFAVWGTANGAGPFSNNTPNESLLLLQLFLGSNAVTFLFLVAVMEERRLSEETLRENERRLAGKLAINRILAESPSLSDATPRMLQTIGETLDWEVGAVWTVDAEANVLRCLNVWHAPSVKAHQFESLTRESAFAPGVGLPGRVWKSLKPAWIPDVTRDENFPRAPVANADGLRAAFAFPIHCGDEFLGVMEFFSQEIRQPDDALLAIFTSIGSQIGQFIERKLTEDALLENREWLRLTMEGSRMGTWTRKLDQSNRVEWSPELEQIFGLERGEFPETEEAFFDFVHPDDRDALGQAVRQAIENHTDYNVEFRYTPKGGEVRWMLGRGRAFYDESGTPFRLAGLGWDITERKRAEEDRAELLAREQTARIEAETATEMTKRLQTVTDAVLQHLAFNDLLKEMLDRVRHVLNTDSVAILLLSEDEQVLTVRAALGLEEEVADKVRVPMGQGIAGHVAASRLPLIVDDTSGIEVVTSMLREKIGSLIAAPLVVESRVLGVIHADKVERRGFTAEDLRLLQLVADRLALAIDRARLYEAEQEARIQAEGANRAKDEFLATVSHELRTPLNAIVGWCSMLQTGRLDQETMNRAIEIIDRNAKVQAQLIEDILDVSRIITGKLSLDIRPVELKQIVETAVDSVRLAADAKGISVQSLLDPRTGPVTGDQNRLQQIVWNLLSNAVKFTPNGGRVQIQLKPINSHVEVIVSDTGQGISAEFLPYVFDQFRQADGAITRRFGGLGLGLAIVRHLVELHGGTIRAESAGEGQGATFTVNIPLATGAHESTALKQHATARKLEIDRSISLAGLRVLVVDDEPDARELLGTILSECDAEVKSTASAAEALAVFREWLPDILISDIEMPDIDGYSLIQRIRRLGAKRGGQVPAVALTAHARIEDRQRALRAGFQVHVAKPVEPGELTMVVAGLTGRIHRRRKRNHR